AALVPNSDRRTTVRHNTQVKVACRVTRAVEMGPWHASLRNVSIRGVSLMADRPFNPGTIVIAEFPSQTGKVAQRLIRVIHVRPQTNQKWWVIGASFAKPLSGAELADML